MRKIPISKALLVLGLVFGVGLFAVGCSSGPSLTTSVTPQEGVVYTFYIGMVDKDSGNQEMSMDEAKGLLTPIFVEAGSGFTAYEATGGYVNDHEDFVENDTLVFTGIHGDEQAVEALIDRIKETLNIESVYCESSYIGYGTKGGTVTEMD